MSAARWLVLIVALILAGLAVVRLEADGRGLERVPLMVGETPATVWRRADAVEAPVVVIAHGFAGSRQLMDSFALSLAQAGYIAVSFDFAGHGRNPVPMSGDVTVIEGTTLVLMDELGRVSDAALALPGSSVRGCVRFGADMDNWDEIRTAYQVARLGTVSGAAEVLGVHHATVIRHIDALERRLGAKLFQRHSRGYTPTEAGRDLLKVAEGAADQFGQLAGRIRGQGSDVAGDLVVTSITGMSPLLVPVLAGFQARHPQVTVRFLTDARLFRLEYGEAHVAIRAGTVPEDPDNVVQPFGTIQAALYASRSYAESQGLSQGPDGFARHRFIGAEGDYIRAPYHRWMASHVPPEQVAFRATEGAALLAAIRGGIGIGFAPLFEAATCADLVQVMPPRPEWEAPLWLVTHVDLHRTPKVQAFLTHLKAEARGWIGAGPAVLDPA